MISFFVIGGILLVLPLALILFWNSSGCYAIGSRVEGYCPSSYEFRILLSFLPFLMLVGGVLIGYNLKKVSDRFSPPEEEEEEGEQESDKEFSTNEINDEEWQN